MKNLFLCFFLLNGIVDCRAQELPLAQHVLVPGYQRLARLAHLQGLVRVRAQISSDGKVIQAKGSGAHKLLEQAAEENIQHWTFYLPSEKLDSAPTIITINFVYKLEGKAKYYDPAPIVVLDLPDKVAITSHPPEPQP